MENFAAKLKLFYINDVGRLDFSFKIKETCIFRYNILQNKILITFFN